MYKAQNFIDVLLDGARNGKSETESSKSPPEPQAIDIVSAKEFQEINPREF
jgi:hypothetical protein